MEAQRVPIDPNTGIPDLIKELAEDSKRLLVDEVQLAKLEMKENLKRGAKGTLWLSVAFGVGVVMLVALTLLLVTLIGRLVNGHMWVGALVIGVLELAVAAYLFKRGIGSFRKPSYTLEETRDTAKDTARWARHPRSAARARTS